MTVNIETRSFTVDEYHKLIEVNILTENERVELLAGEIVKMSPIGMRHAGCVIRLTHIFSRIGSERAMISVQNPILLDELSEPEPDVAILRPRPDFYTNAHPTPDDVLLLIEVADTSIEYERNVKIPLYAQAGIVEVWLIDLNENQVEVYRQPGNEGYQIVKQTGQDQSIVPITLPDFLIDVGELGLN